MQNIRQNAAIKDSGARTATRLDLRLKAPSPAQTSLAEREVSASQFLPYACHYNDSTILTKSGDLLQIIKIDGLPFETADPDWLTFQKNLRNTLLRTIAKNQYAVYVHTIRRKQKVYPEGIFPTGFSKDLNEA